MLFWNTEKIQRNKSEIMSGLKLPTWREPQFTYKCPFFLSLFFACTFIHIYTANTDLPKCDRFIINIVFNSCIIVILRWYHNVFKQDSIVSYFSCFWISLSINHIFLNIYIDNYIHTSIIIPWDESLKIIKNFNIKHKWSDTRTHWPGQRDTGTPTHCWKLCVVLLKPR